MTSQARKPWIAILEGDDLVCRSIVRLTWSYGVHCEALKSAHEFIAAMESGRSSGPSCVILDADSPELDDPSVLEHFKRISSHTPLILLGSGDKTRLREHSLAAVAGAFFEKPIDVRALHGDTAGDARYCPRAVIARGPPATRQDYTAAVPRPLICDIGDIGDKASSATTA